MYRRLSYHRSGWFRFEEEFVCLRKQLSVTTLSHQPHHHQPSHMKHHQHMTNRCIECQPYQTNDSFSVKTHRKLAAIVPKSLLFGLLLYCCCLQNIRAEPIENRLTSALSAASFSTDGKCFRKIPEIDNGDPMSISWMGFKKKYGKNYEDEGEEEKRHKIFTSTMRFIESHNEDYRKCLKTYFLAPNEFADLTEVEIAKISPPIDQSRIRRRHIRQPKFRYRTRTRTKPTQGVQLPDEIDWRDYGIVPSVKYQGNCGSCWAFTAVGVIEIQNIRRVGKLLDLSEQQLIDCSKGYGNHGCDGGFIDPSFHYVRDNQGINTDKVYPYEAKEGICRYNPYSVGATVTQWVDLESGNELKLKETLVYVGPVASAFDGRQRSFRYYKGGIYVEENCTRNVLDHSGVIVGYGRESGIDYWIIKNSWGKRWGENGYIRFARNRRNMCGIASLSSYPLVF